MSSGSIYKSAEGERAIMALYDGLLDRWPVPKELLWVPTRHGSTFIVASGDVADPPLVLLHGACSNAASWIGDVALYSRSCRVFAVDLPGEPGRSARNRPSWKGGAFGEWLEDVLDGLGVGRAALLGISQGGWTALSLATRRPDRVTRLVLLAPAGVTSARASFVLRAVPLSLMGRRGAGAIVRLTLGGQALDPEATRYMEMIMTHFKPRVGALPLYSDRELARLTMPTLLMVGARDPLLDSDATATRMRGLVPHLAVKVLPEEGHVLTGLAQGIAPFLAGRRAA
jgi:pimeloyl-ACP methyl ester carboxylesterase